MNASPPTPTPIPIRSLYFMLSYAWQSGQTLATELHGADFERLRTPQSLVAWWLAAELNRLAGRGLVRGYVARDEVLGTVRGSIDLAQLARTVAAPTRMPCHYDELDHDTWLNRRIARALRAASRTRLDDAAYEAVRRSLRSLGQIGDDRGRLRRAKLGRQEQHYRVALTLADIILRHVVPHDSKGAEVAHDFRDFTQNQRWAGALFERFLRAVITHEQSRYRARIRTLKHLARARPGLGQLEAKALLPSLRTDICLEDSKLPGPRRTVAVIESKFYASPLVRGPYDERGRLRASHIDQLFGYMKALAEKGEPVKTGLLVYAAPSGGADAGFDVAYTIDGFDLMARTIALDAAPLDLIAEVLSLLDRLT